jgi:hypothetical protein
MPMRGLRLLVRLAQRKTDECRGSLVEASLAKADADAALVAHHNGIASEGRVAVYDPAMLATLGAWCRHAARAHAQLQARKNELDHSEAAARDALRSAFIDLKRLEMAQEAAVRRERTTAIRRVEIRADEPYASARTSAAD